MPTGQGLVDLIAQSFSIVMVDTGSVQRFQVNWSYLRNIMQAEQQAMARAGQRTRTDKGTMSLVNLGSGNNASIPSTIVIGANADASKGGPGQSVTLFEPNVSGEILIAAGGNARKASDNGDPGGHAVVLGNSECLLVALGGYGAPGADNAKPSAAVFGSTPGNSGGDGGDGGIAVVAGIGGGNNCFAGAGRGGDGGLGGPGQAGTRGLSSPIFGWFRTASSPGSPGGDGGYGGPGGAAYTVVGEAGFIEVIGGDGGVGGQPGAGGPGIPAGFWTRPAAPGPAGKFGPNGWGGDVYYAMGPNSQQVTRPGTGLTTGSVRQL